LILKAQEIQGVIKSGKVEIEKAWSVISTSWNYPKTLNFNFRGVA